MSENFPPPPPEQPQPRPQQPDPWAAGPVPSPWAAPAAPPRKQRTGLVVTLSVGGALVLAGAVVALVYSLLHSVSDSIALPPERTDAPYDAGPVEPAPKPTATEPDVAQDVTITACTRDPAIGWQSADVTVVNGSAAAADYVISVEFLDKNGVKVSEGVTGILGLGPGRTAEKKVQGLGEVPRGTTCRIDDLSRTPSESEAAPEAGSESESEPVSAPASAG
ncbi:hypothetical protein [Streptomyces sp. NPDC006267]|uniref:hypothetical protein n=1 Tax=Streptomyces sp. NPDC006267 TaxID=3157173 RepID=UPI0033A84B20